jgi:DNA-binding NarL/FixJ family response regulator
MNKIIKLGIAEDHLVLRQGIISLLNDYENIEVIFDVNNGKELLDAIKNNKPDIVILDIEMPTMDGKESLEKIKLNYPDVKVIILSMHFEDAFIYEFIKNGACAFLPKQCSIDSLVDAIHNVYIVGHYYDAKVSEAMANMIKKNSATNTIINDAIFTSREINIIKLICQRKTNKEIAEELELSVRTVEGHRYNISKKTGINNTLDLVDFVTINKLL